MAHPILYIHKADHTISCVTILEPKFPLRGKGKGKIKNDG
jgi:hypothetical protein